MTDVFFALGTSSGGITNNNIPDQGTTLVKLEPVPSCSNQDDVVIDQSSGGNTENNIPDQEVTTLVQLEPVPSCSHQEDVVIDQCLMKVRGGKLNYEYLLGDTGEDNTDEDPDFLFLGEESDSSDTEYNSVRNIAKTTRLVKPNPLHEVKNKLGKERVRQNEEEYHIGEEVAVGYIGEEIRNETAQENDENIAPNNSFQVKAKGTRQKRKNIENWKDNQRKKKRNSGLEYITRKGKTIKKRSPKVRCESQLCTNCKLFTEDECKKFFSDFWNLGDLRLQREYIIKRVAVQETART